MKRVVLVSNKWWECDPILFTLLNDNARPPNFPWPKGLQTARRRPDQNSLPAENTAPLPRAVFSFKNLSAELWCISDLLEHLPDKGIYQSSSEQKARVLPRIFAYGPQPDFVVALGTAGLPSDASSENGNVVVGTKTFMHNGHPANLNPNSNWQQGPFDIVLDSLLAVQAFQAMTRIDWASVADRFLTTPMSPAPSNRSIAGYEHVALCTVNVTDYTEYTVKDVETVEKFSETAANGSAMSLETTHGLIRVQSTAPFLFISGITDRLGHFDQEVNPRVHAQNMAAAHNAGIALAWMLPRIDQTL